MHDIIVFTPVGTSIAKNETNIGKRLINNRVKSLKQCSISLKDVFTGKVRINDPHPAEISSLYKFGIDKKCHLTCKEVNVILIHSPNEGKCCASGLKFLIEDGSYFPKPSKSTWCADLVELCSLDPKKSEKFPMAVEELFQVIEDSIKCFSGEIYINITGGYKGLLPYLTMLGMALAKINIFYLFEESTEIIELPTYPMAFDLMEWRDWRGLLLPFTLQGDSVLNNKQKEQLYNAVKGEKVAGLIDDKPPYNYNSIGLLMHRLYEEGKGRVISEFGSGSILLDLFRDQSYARYLRGYCIPKWRYLSVGDHIPETVEHGRGHVQRLLELAQQVLVATELKLTDEQLFVLICSIWLHDLGHSGDFFYYEGQNGLVQKPNDTGDESKFSVYGDPDKVRKYHNFLTYQLLKENKLFLFPNSTDFDLTDHLTRSIQIACLYHRVKMPVENGHKYNEEVMISRGIKEFGRNVVVIPGFPVVAALLRFIDGAENQEERSGSNDYYEVAQWVINRQICFREKHQDYSSNQQSPLYKETKFKESQKRHFIRHRWIRHVFFAGETNEVKTKRNVYGSEGANKPILGAYIISNPTMPGYGDNDDNVINELISDFLNEFWQVKDILPFRLVLFLLKPESVQGEYEKHQINIKIDEKKEPKEWNYSLQQIK